MEKPEWTFLANPILKIWLEIKRIGIPGLSLEKEEEKYMVEIGEGYLDKQKGCSQTGLIS